VFGHRLVPNYWEQQRLGGNVRNTIGVTGVSPLAERVELPPPADYASSRVTDARSAASRSGSSTGSPWNAAAGRL